MTHCNGSYYVYSAFSAGNVPRIVKKKKGGGSDAQLLRKAVTTAASAAAKAMVFADVLVVLGRCNETPVLVCASPSRGGGAGCVCLGGSEEGRCKHATQFPYNQMHG